MNSLQFTRGLFSRKISITSNHPNLHIYSGLDGLDNKALLWTENVLIAFTQLLKEKLRTIVCRLFEIS